MFIRCVSILIALTLLLLTRPAAADDTKYEVEVRKNVEYGTGGGEKLLLDLALPKGVTKPVPALIFLHGGGWAAGAKDKFALSRYLEPFAATGYVVASVEYRFAPKHIFPAQIEDAKCAVRYLRAHATELALDPKRIGAMGDSAGGHLSLLLGTMDPAHGCEGTGGWADQPSKVQAVVDYYGPTNLLEEFPNSVPHILQNFLGGTRGEKADLYKQASPLTYVNAGDAPTLIFHGTVDALVPYDQAVQMATALTKAKVDGRVELLVGRGHGWGGDDATHTSAQALEFFNKALKK